MCPCRATSIASGLKAHLALQCHSGTLSKVRTRVSLALAAPAINCAAGRAWADDSDPSRGTIMLLNNAMVFTPAPLLCAAIGLAMNWA